MLPTTRELAMQMAVWHELHPDHTVSEMASHLGYSPIFIINAMHEGEGMELFTNDKENDALVAVIPVNYESSMGLDFGADITRIQNEILRAVAYENARENDIEIGRLIAWHIGVKPSAFEIAVHILKRIGFIVQYQLTDNTDEESTYEFLTLALNSGKDWGAKQFKNNLKK